MFAAILLLFSPYQCIVLKQSSSCSLQCSHYRFIKLLSDFSISFQDAHNGYMTMKFKRGRRKSRRVFFESLYTGTRRLKSVAARPS